MSFAEFVREKRVQMGLSLRAFCLTYKEDASNWSKLERGLLPAPSDEERLEDIGGKLNLTRVELQEMIDLACAEKGKMPPDLASDSSLVPHLPVVFRALRDGEDAEERLRNLAEMIRKERQGQ